MKDTKKVTVSLIEEGNCSVYLERFKLRLGGSSSVELGFGLLRDLIILAFVRPSQQNQFFS
jgi:hypothetical protein